MKNFHISKDISELSISFAEWIVSYADEVLKKKDIEEIMDYNGIDYK